MRVPDTPGFVVNRVLMAMINQAARLAAEGGARPDDIDKALRLGANFPMGPLALADFIGIDVVVTELREMARTLGETYQPAPVLLEMIESGILEESLGGWEVSSPIESVPLPKSVSGIIRTRIDRLVKSLRDALLQSSVLGRDFSGDLFKRIREILEEDTGTGDHLLRELCRRGFLSRIGEVDGTTYSFPHDLIRDAAYDMLLHHNRAVLHRCAALALEADPEFLLKPCLVSSVIIFTEIRSEFLYLGNAFSKAFI